MTTGCTIEHCELAGHAVTALRFAAPGAMNRALAEAILSRELEIRSTTPSDPVAGLDDGLTTHWKNYNVLTWPEPACTTLREGVLEACRAWLEANQPPGPDHDIIAISCWANVLRGGEGLAPHNHSPALLLGNYLVDEGGGSGGATLYFAADGSATRLPPEPGRLIVCGAQVRHAVEPSSGPRPRISVAMDGFVRRQNPYLYLGMADAMAAFQGPRWLTFPATVEEIPG